MKRVFHRPPPTPYLCFLQSLWLRIFVSNFSEHLFCVENWTRLCELPKINFFRRMPPAF